MDDSKVERWGAWAGIAFVVLILVTAFLPGSPPKLSDSSAKITKFFVDKADEMRIVTYVGGLATVAVLLWLGALYRVLRRAEGAAQLSVSALAGGIIAAALTTTGGVVLGAVAILKLQNGIEPAGVRFFYVLGNMLVIAAGFGVIVLIGATSLIVARTGIMPKWIAVLGLVDVLLWFVATGAVTSTKDFVFYFSLAAFGLFAIWVLSVSIMMLRSAGEGSGSPEVAEASAT